MNDNISNPKGFALNKAIRNAIAEADPIEVHSVIAALAFTAGEICVNANPENPHIVAEYFVERLAHSVKIFIEEGAKN